MFTETGMIHTPISCWAVAGGVKMLGRKTMTVDLSRSISETYEAYYKRLETTLSIKLFEEMPVFILESNASTSYKIVARSEFAARFIAQKYQITHTPILTKQVETLEYHEELGDIIRTKIIIVDPEPQTYMWLNPSKTKCVDSGLRQISEETII